MTVGLGEEGEVGIVDPRLHYDAVYIYIYIYI
jgi:hypothetical protein